MRKSCEGFACVECGGDMEEIAGVPVLQSLQDHAVHCCVGCGHILLVQPDRSEHGSANWLSLECGGAISCAALL
jgi:hypothetical protein